MRTQLAVLSLAMALCSGRAICDDHLASAEVTAARLAEASSVRDADLAAVQEILSSPEAAAAASALGADPRQVQSVAVSLGDAELRDLAVRAAALHADPAAGLSRDVDQLLVVFLIVAIVILVLKAID